MRVSGFTFVRNGILMDYPFVESIKSMLPLCDELVVAVGNSTDGTREIIEKISDPKIRIIDTVWDDNMRQGGAILAFQTNIALAEITGDWGLYLQADEVLHEEDYPEIKKAMELYYKNPNVEGLLFNYKHFYGTYEYVATASHWYRREIRIIKNLPGMKSYKDAQGFRIDDRKIKVKLINASIYHYGWVKNPRSMQAKNESFPKYWHDDTWIEEHVIHMEESEYNLLETLSPYHLSHPALMSNRIKARNWKFPYVKSKSKFIFKNWFRNFIFKRTGHMLWEYKNYKKI